MSPNLTARPTQRDRAWSEAAANLPTYKDHWVRLGGVPMLERQTCSACGLDRRSGRCSACLATLPSDTRIDR